jgi:hypothetical protein
VQQIAMPTALLGNSPTTQRAASRGAVNPTHRL